MLCGVFAACEKQPKKSSNLPTRNLSANNLWLNFMGAGQNYILILLFTLLAGCKPKIESEDMWERYNAIRSIHDESLLTRVALDDEDDFFVAREAANKLETQALLAKVAIGSASYYARSNATIKLVRPFVFAKILNFDQEKAIMYVAECNDDVLLRELEETTLRGHKAGSLSEYKQKHESHSQIWRGCGVIAALKLSLNDPIVRSRLPGMKLKVEVSTVYEGYQLWLDGWPKRGFAVKGQQVEMSLCQNDAAVVKKTCKPDYPVSPDADTSECFFPNLVSKDFLVPLLRRHEFTKQDICSIATNSTIAELRAAAVALIDQPDLVCKIMRTDAAPQVRLSAIHVTHNEELLSIIASDRKENLRIRKAAIDAITSTSVLKKLTSTSEDWVTNAADYRLWELRQKHK